MSKKSVLTFVGKSFAQKGFRFCYQGINPACTKDCRLFQTCQANLEKGQVYEIVEILKNQQFEPKIHGCPKELHEEEMFLVRVQVPDTIVTVRNKELYLGSVISFTPINCDKEDCPHYQYCVPEVMVKPKEKITIKETIEKITDCAKGETLSKVRVEKK